MTEPGPSHLDLDALADALAGEAGADAAAHLAGCASCTSRLAELEAAEAGVVAALAALPDPPLPDGLAERLSAAFAAEPRPAPVRTNVTALPERAPRRRFLPAAAAAVLLVSAGGLGYTLLTPPGGGDEGADTAAGASAPAYVLNASGLDYADSAAVSGALPSLLAGNSDVLLTADSAEAQMDSGAGGTTGTAASRSAGEELTAQAPAAAGADPLARLRTPEGLEDCLAGVLPPEEPDLRPRALDYAQYQGQPALAVLLPDPDPAKVSVFVVGPECTAADAKVVGFFRIDAP